MSTKLPGPIAAYFAATNQHDVDASLAPFADDAVVKDEGQQRRGRAAVRAWIAESIAKYRVTVEIVGVAGTHDAPIVTGRVSGNFPGSPVELDYAFTLDGEKIARLEIG